MLTSIDPKKRPPVFLSASDKTRLADLLDTVSEDSPVAAMLGEEIGRAIVVSDRSERRFVRLGSQVEIETALSGRTRIVRLAMPEETDIDAGDLSVLTLAGAAVIGLREGAAVSWVDPHNRRQTVRVLRIIEDGNGGDDAPSAA